MVNDFLLEYSKVIYWFITKYPGLTIGLASSLNPDKGNRIEFVISFEDTNQHKYAQGNYYDPEWSNNYTNEVLQFVFKDTQKAILGVMKPKIEITHPEPPNQE